MSARAWVNGRVAVAGVGCTTFGERWRLGPADLLREAAAEALNDAGVDRKDIEAAWIGNYYSTSGVGGASMADALGIHQIPITRVENYCASGMDAFRNACFAIAAGAYDLVLVCGVEKLSDNPATGLPPIIPMDPARMRPSSPGLFALAATRAFHVWGWSEEDLARVAVKNHKNGARHPKAHFRREISMDEAMQAPSISSPLRRFDCCPTSDGASAIVLASAAAAKRLHSPHPGVLVSACETVTATAYPQFDQASTYLGFPATVEAAKRAYRTAGISDPRKEIDFLECHDCFTITELLNMQDLQLCESGTAVDLVKGGLTASDGELPVNPSGGLKSFGHPVGATGCRMIFEVTMQLQGRALGHQVTSAERGLAHTLGGPGAVASVVILELA